MRDLPRQLSVDELAGLFEGRTRFVERLAGVEDPLGQARAVERVLHLREPIDEACSPLEELGELLGAQLPR